MKAVIIAGGMGTRLRPFTFSIPKPLLPVGEKPILELILKKLRSLGIFDLTMTLGYGAELIEAYFGDGRKFGVKIKYTRETKPLGTAGPLKLIKGLKEPFLVMNGDILTDLDFNKMLEFHRENGASMTIAARTHADRLPFGTISADGDLVTDITEKPVKEYLISTGIYILEPATLGQIPGNTFFTMPELIKKLIRGKKPVLKYQFDDYWLAIERVEQLEEASKKTAPAVRI
ncbi:MAG: sugar phosphate nucleotidyltransferase [Elusimicrobiales bacterium]|jgi:NDP-sugar pyrophosphorylase family protein